MSIKDVRVGSKTRLEDFTYQEQEVLKGIWKGTSYHIHDIIRVYEVCNSYDYTVKILEEARATGEHPLSFCRKK